VSTDVEQPVVGAIAHGDPVNNERKQPYSRPISKSTRMTTTTKPNRPLGP
jgi:hypothetical protein